MFNAQQLFQQNDYINQLIRVRCVEFHFKRIDYNIDYNVLILNVNVLYLCRAKTELSLLIELHTLSLMARAYQLDCLTNEATATLCIHFV